jgi:chromosome segregation ATPase
LSTELWARKPLEDRVSSLTDEVAQLRVERQEWINRCNANITSALQASEQLFAAKDAIKSAQRARDELQLQVDELRLELTSIASAEDVYSMLQEMLDDTEWVGQCLDSSTCEQMSCIQRTISVIAQRVGDME